MQPAARSDSGLGFIPVYALAVLGQTRFNNGGIIGKTHYEGYQNTLYA